MKLTLKTWSAASTLTMPKFVRKFGVLAQAEGDGFVDVLRERVSGSTASNGCDTVPVGAGLLRVDAREAVDGAALVEIGAGGGDEDQRSESGCVQGGGDEVLNGDELAGRQRDGFVVRGGSRIRRSLRPEADQNLLRGVAVVGERDVGAEEERAAAPGNTARGGKMKARAETVSVIADARTPAARAPARFPLREQARRQLRQTG